MDAILRHEDIPCDFPCSLQQLVLRKNLANKAESQGLASIYLLPCVEKIPAAIQAQQLPEQDLNPVARRDPHVGKVTFAEDGVVRADHDVTEQPQFMVHQERPVYRGDDRDLKIQQSEWLSGLIGIEDVVTLSVPEGRSKTVPSPALVIRQR